MNRGGKPMSDNHLSTQFDAEPGKEEEGQQLMARVTGNYKRGNERVARQHPRNRS